MNEDLGARPDEEEVINNTGEEGGDDDGENNDGNKFGDTPEDIEEAQKYGYKTPEEYDGNPKYQVSAKEYLDRRKKGGIVKAQESQINDLNSKLDETNQAIKRMGEFHKLQIKRAREDALKEAKEKYSQSISDGDITPEKALENYEADKSQIEQEHKEPEQEEAKPVRKVVDAPPIKQFVEENPWYEKDLALQGAANSFHRDIASKHPTMSLADQLQMVKKRVVEEFPQKFANPKKNHQSIEAGGGSVHTNGPRASANTFKSIDLGPADIIDAQSLIKQGLYKDEAEFVKDYKRMNGVK